MIRLADFCYRKRRFVLVAWILALVVIVGIGSSVGSEHRANYQTPGAEATKAYELLGERFPARAGDAVNIVYTAEAGITDPAVQADIEKLIATVETLPMVSRTVSPYSPDGATQKSEDGKIAFIEVDFDRTMDKVFNEDVKYPKKFIETVEPFNRSGLQVEVSTFVKEQELGSEGIGFLFAAFVLLVAFGSVLAMGLPLLTALFGLAIGAMIGGIGSTFIETPDWAPSAATMIALGVGIDYALFIITRYRTSLHDGMEPREAVITAMGTAGKAVLFAGMTVVISLLGMLTMGLSYLNGVAFSSIVGVLAMLAASLTLLPAILGFVGRKIDKWRVPFTGRPSHQGQRAFWYRWSRFVQRRPWPSFALGAGVLVLITLPVFSLRFGFPDEGNNPPEQTSRKAYDLLSEAFGPGFNGPLLLVADLGTSGDQSALEELALQLKTTDGVAQVGPVIPNPDGSAAIVNVYPTTKPQEAETDKLVHRLRDDVIPKALDGSTTTVLVGGFTAISVDQTSYISNRLPIFIGAVVFLSFLLLTMVFRSPLVALKAGIMNLLSIAAAYGVMSYAVHDTWLGHLLDIPETPVPAFLPMIMFAILFGLSMDYEVFLLSRIREEYLRTGDNGTAVADGLAATARVITAAAAIMVFVFGAFVVDPNVFIKQMGLGLATAVLVDATIVRMILVPATMELLGNANWWMPAWLDRLLPEIHIEGEDAVAKGLAGLSDGEPALVAEKV